MSKLLNKPEITTVRVKVKSFVDGRWVATPKEIELRDKDLLHADYSYIVVGKKPDERFAKKPTDRANEKFAKKIVEKPEE